MPRHPTPSRAAETLSAGVYTGLLQAARESGGPVYPLHVGDTWRPPPDCARLERIADQPDEGMFNYAPVQGIPALLDAIEARMARRGRPVTRANLQVTPGSTAGLNILCAALLQPGDEVILPSPFWPLIRGIIEARGAVARQLPICTEWQHPDFDLAHALEAVVSKRTVALYFNSPHNPTGHVLDRVQQDAIAQVARRHDLWVISDEAYEELDFGPPGEALWQHPDLQDRAIGAHTCSKTFGMAGARVGFLHGPAQIMQSVQALQAFMTYNAARPMQHAAAVAMAHPEGDRWVQRARALYQEAAERAARTLAQPRVQSGTFAFFDTRPFLRTGEDAGDLLLRCARRGVVMTRGDACGADHAAWARLCFTAVPPDQLNAAMDILAEELRPQ